MKKTIILMCLSLVLVITGVLGSSAAWADIVSFSVQGQGISYSTGSGADGDVVIQKIPGQSNSLVVLVNGVVKFSEPYQGIGTASTNGNLYTSTQNTNQDLIKTYSLPVLQQAHFTGNPQNSHNTAYLYAYANGSWSQLDYEHYTFDKWITLPANTTQIKVELRTSYYYFSPAAFADVPEVVGTSTIYPPTQTVLKNTMELDGRALSSRSDSSYEYIAMEQIAPYLPSTKTYSPSGTTSMGTVPQFNNLTIGPGIILTSNTHVAFYVKGTLNVQGIIMSQHGQGGQATSSGNVDGANAKGNVLIMAYNINVAPNGNTGEYGAILAGWGGGGGSYYSTPGKGGNGGSVYIYANTLTSKGEIRSGNGGGGAASNGNAAAGGYAGNTYVYANNLIGGGVIASGYSGVNGSYSQGRHNVTGGGYGGGAAGGDGSTVTVVGGTGGTAGGGDSEGGTSGFGGSTGGGGYLTVGVSRPDGVLTVVVKNLQYLSGVTPKFMVGYSSGGWYTSLDFYECLSTGVYVSTTIHVESITGSPTVSIIAGGYIDEGYENPLNTFSESNSNIFGTLSAPVNVNFNDIRCNSVYVYGNTTITGKLFWPENAVTSTGNLTLSTSSNIITDCTVPTITAGSTLTVEGSIDPTSWWDCPLGPGAGGGSWGYSNMVFTAPNIVLVNNSNYATPGYFSISRKIIANGITLSNPVLSVVPSPFGALELDLSDYGTQYSSSYPTFNFDIQRLVESGSWTDVDSFSRNLVGDLSWYDVNTPLDQNCTYRLGYALPGNGFVFNDMITAGPVKSEGSAIIDTDPPKINYLQVGDADGQSTSRYTAVTFSATDNKTIQSQLSVQFEVNGQYYYYSGGHFVTGNSSNWGSYSDSYSNLDLGATNKSVPVTVRVKDLAGNIGMGAVNVAVETSSGYVNGGTATISGATAGTYNGMSVNYVKSENLQMNLNFSSAAKMRVGFDGFNMPDWEQYTSSYSITLPKSSGLVTMILQVMDSTGAQFTPQKIQVVVDNTAPIIDDIETVSGAMATSGSSIQAVVDAADNDSTQLWYSLNNTNFNLMPTNGIITLPVTSPGENLINVWVKDAAGNETKASIEIRKI